MRHTYHRHHIIPRHAGGTDDASNIIICSVEVHAYLHRIRYATHKQWQDKLAYQGLEGIISKKELLHTVAVETGRAGGKIGGKLSRTPKGHPGGKKQGMVNASNGHLKRIANSAASKLYRKKVVQCPHCAKVGHHAPMMRWHFNNCRLLV